MKAFPVDIYTACIFAIQSLSYDQEQKLQMYHFFILKEGAVTKSISVVNS